MQEVHNNDSNQLKKKRQSCRHERYQRIDDQTLHQESQETLTTTAQQSHQTKLGTTTNLAAHDDQSHLQVTHHHHPTTDPSVLQPTLEAAGFTQGYSTTDHSFTPQQSRQRAAEWHHPLWAAVNDFQKGLRHS